MMAYREISRRERGPLFIRYSRPEKLSKSYYPYFNRHPSSATDLFLTFISPGGRTGRLRKQPGNPVSKSSGALYRASRSRSAWALRATFASGRNCCGLAIENCGWLSGATNGALKKVCGREIALPPPALAASWLPDRASRVLRRSVSRHCLPRCAWLLVWLAELA